MTEPREPTDQLGIGATDMSTAQSPQLAGLLASRALWHTRAARSVKPGQVWKPDRSRDEKPQLVQCAAFFMPGFRLWRPRQGSRKARR